MLKSPQIAVVLSGCGVYDGSEIHEAVCTLLALDEAGAQYQCFAPNSWQTKTIDHFTGQVTAFDGDDDNRNVLAESARIARGEIKDLAEFRAQNFDAIIFPGGMGAALNLCNSATKGPDCEVLPEVERAIEESFNHGIVIGAMCIAPTIVARILGKHKIKLTIGKEQSIANGLQKMGAQHQNCEATEVCVDIKHKIVTTPCYMLAKSIKEVAAGTRNLVAEVLELV